MKKSKVVLVILVPIVITVALLLSLYGCFYSGLFWVKTNDIKITSDTLTDVQYNRGDLIKIGEKLYYNYEPDNELCDLIKGGLYEISSFGANRVYWPGIHISIAKSSNLFSMLAINGQIAKQYQYNPEGESENSSGKIIKLNTFFHGFDTLNELQTPPPETLNSYTYIDGVYFYFSDSVIYKQVDSKLVDIVEIPVYTETGLDPLLVYFLSKNEFYYIKPNGGESVLCHFDVEKGKETDLLNLKCGYEGCCRLSGSNDKLVLDLLPDWDSDNADDAFERTYVIDLVNSSEPQKIIDGKSWSCYSDEAYDGVLYVGLSGSQNTEMGIYAIDMNYPHARQKIYDGQAYSIHILDSKWIYFTDDKEALYRITHDGKTLEKVFG